MRAIWFFCLGLLMLSAQLFPDPASGENRQEVAGPIDTAKPSDPSSASHIPAAPLEAGEDGPPLAPYVYFQRNYAGDLRSGNWIKQEDNLSPLSGSIIQFGAGATRVMVQLKLRNNSTEPGTWFLSTGRGALKDFMLVERRGDTSHVLIDGSDSEEVGRILRAYHGFTQPLELQPGETRHFALSFDGVQTTVLPLAIKTSSSFREESFWNIAIAAGGFVGTLTLVIIGAVFYAATGKPEFLWLSSAELVLAVYIVHVSGYTTFYYLHDKDNLVFAVNMIVPLAYTAIIIQFARIFLRTAKNFPKFNKFLIGMIALSLFSIAWRLYLYLSGQASDASIFGWLAVLLIMMMQYVLPAVALLAIIRLSFHYWPLLIAWGGWSLFNHFGMIAALGYFEELPFNWNFTGLAALFTGLFTSLALALHIRRVHLDKLESERGLNESLTKQLEIQEEATRLEREKASAIATIHDQDNLIHASGHDSQQVLMALNSIVSVTDRAKSDGLPGELGDMLKSSASYLQDIVSTTTSGAISGFENSSFIALNRFRFAELIRPIEMIYRPLFVKKQIVLDVDIRSDEYIVSDRALLARVLSNLLGNSLKFTDKGHVTLSAWTDGDTATMAVRDTGAGMDPALLSRLTGSEEGRVKIEDSEGTGFGLISSRAIITRLYGKLDIYSQKGTGTTISVTLPRSGAAQAEPVTSDRMEDQVPGVRLLDVDRTSRDEVEKLKNCPSSGSSGRGKSHIVPVTHDSSANMRSWVGSFANLALIKPVWTDMLDHPALAHLQNSPGDQ